MASMMNQSTQMEVPDTVTDPVANMSKHQLYQVLSQMKNLIHHNQEQARQVLISNPQLTKTLFQAQIVLGMVRAPDTSSHANISAQASQPTQAQVPTDGPEEVRNIIQHPVIQNMPPQQGQDHQPMPTKEQVHQHRSIQGQDHQRKSAQGQVQQSQPPVSAEWQPNQPSSSQQPPEAPNAAMPPDPSAFLYQQCIQTHQQPSFPLSSMSSLSQSQSIPSSSLQSPVQYLPPQNLQPPPLPQQPRQSGVLQHQISQGFGEDPLRYHPQFPYQMSQGDMNTNTNNANFTLGGHSQAGISSSVGFSGGSTPFGGWDQAMASTGYHPYSDPSSLTHVQGYAQPLPQPQRHELQVEPQIASDAEQQMILLEKVMNLTPEQIDLLAPEQRQQVIQVQQAFRNRTV